MQSISFGHNWFGIHNKNKKVYRTSTDIGKLNNTCINNAGDNGKIKLKLETILNGIPMKIWHIRFYSMLLE